MSGISIPGHCTCLPPHRGYPYRCSIHRISIDNKVMEIFPIGMRDGVDLKIEFRIGFEDWGTYETWGQGWVIEGGGVTSADKYFDTAFNKWYEKAKAKNASV